MPRVLIADDEPNIREVISFALERAGFQTITARNGSEALQQVRRGPVDLIVLDIGMMVLSDWMSSGRTMPATIRSRISKLTRTSWWPSITRLPLGRTWVTTTATLV